MDIVFVRARDTPLRYSKHQNDSNFKRAAAFAFAVWGPLCRFLTSLASMRTCRSGRCPAIWEGQVTQQGRGPRCSCQNIRCGRGTRAGTGIQMRKCMRCGNGTSVPAGTWNGNLRDRYIIRQMIVIGKGTLAGSGDPSFHRSAILPRATSETLTINYALEQK